MDDTTLYHITSGARWRNEPGPSYGDPSLATDGFIHCSYRHQLLIPANERFRGQTGLILLAIDPNRLSADVIVEDSYGSGMAFPHIYGTIERGAVTRVIDFSPKDDGVFALPPELG